MHSSNRIESKMGKGFYHWMHHYSFRKYTVTTEMEILSLFDIAFVSRYDPATDTWTQVACLSLGCDSAGVSLLGDRLFCVGGYDGQTYLNLVHAYDPQTNEWTQVRDKSV